MFAPHRPKSTPEPEIRHGLPWCPCGRLLRRVECCAGVVEYRCQNGHVYALKAEGSVA